MYEVQFNYIHQGKIQTEDKFNLIKTLVETKDLELFNTEPIQVIIDYKWNKYGQNFFIVKLVIYFIFMVFFFIDVELLYKL